MAEERRAAAEAEEHIRKLAEIWKPRAKPKKKRGEKGAK